MADNTTLSAGTADGAVVKTDEVAPGHYQRVKITDGVADSEVHLGIVADDAAVVAADTGILSMAVATPTDASVDANDTGYVGMSTDRRLHTDSDLQINGTAITAAAGAVAATTPRVTLGSDDPAVALLATIDSDTNTIQSDTTGILADTAAIDTATAAINAKLVTGTVIGDVNLGATDNAVLDQIEVNTSYGEVVGGGTEATALRVTVANDSTGVMTVDGTVTANPASGTIDTVTTVTTANLAAETTKVIGTVRVASGGIASGSLASGSVASGAVASGAFASGALAAGAVTDLPLPSGAATSANQVAKATGGMSYTMLGIAAADNDVVIKASAATVYFISVQSIDATPVYLKLFDLASFTPGTSAADLQFMCPSQGTALGSGVVLNFGDHGIQFGTGLCALIATGFALDDNTAVSANEVIVTIGWE